MNWDKIWAWVINQSHVQIACVCQATIFIMHYRYGKDITPGVQQTVNWFYLFLAGHFGASQVWPDKPAPAATDNSQQTTDVTNVTVVAAPTPPAAPAAGSAGPKG